MECLVLTARHRSLQPHSGQRTDRHGATKAVRLAIVARRTARSAATSPAIVASGVWRRMIRALASSDARARTSFQL